MAWLNFTSRTQIFDDVSYMKNNATTQFQFFTVFHLWNLEREEAITFINDKFDLWMLILLIGTYENRITKILLSWFSGLETWAKNELHDTKNRMEISYKSDMPINF